MDSSRIDSGQGARVVSIEGKERRVCQRRRCWGTTWINFLPEQIRQVAYLIDLGLGGCCIESDTAMPAAPHMCVEVHLNVDGFTLQLAGVIRHVEKNTRAGIEFTDMSLRKVEQIHRLMAALIEAEKIRLAGVEELGG